MGGFDRKGGIVQPTEGGVADGRGSGVYEAIRRWCPTREQRVWAGGQTGDD